MQFFIFILSLITISVKLVNCAKLEEKFAWKQLKFAWPSKEIEQEANTSGDYIPYNNLPLGLETWNDKLFITIPRWKSGVASTLNYVKLSSDEKSPILQPYPDWEANKLPKEEQNEENGEKTKGLKNNSTIISTFRVQADECDRLWVMDTGLADILGNGNQHAPAAIVIFNLNNDQLIRRYSIPESQVKEDTFFPNIVLDVSKDDCDNAFAYIPDLGGYGLIVYSFKDNKSWRIKHNFFHFDPLNGDFNVGGINFQWTDGVFGVAVGEQKLDGTKDVYFHAFASNKEFVVSNKILQNETHVTNRAAYYDFKLLGDRGQNGQSSAEVYDKNTNSVFYTQVNKDAIGCWNTNMPYNPDTQGLVDSDSTALIFPNDVKVDRNGTLWVLSDRMPTFLYKTLDENDFNYRVMFGNTKELVKGTPCEGSQ